MGKAAVNEHKAALADQLADALTIAQELLQRNGIERPEVTAALAKWRSRNEL